MSKDITIDSIRSYQAVTFEKKNETFFSTRQINTRRSQEISFFSDSIIEVKSASDHILIPITNISAIYLKSPIKIRQEERAKEELKKNSKAVNTPAHTIKRK